jgi:hypothetical protein
MQNIYSDTMDLMICIYYKLFCSHYNICNCTSDTVKLGSSFCEIWGFYSSDSEHYCLLGCYTVYFGKLVSMFHRNLLSPSSRSFTSPMNHMASHSRRQYLKSSSFLSYFTNYIPILHTFICMQRVTLKLWKEKCLLLALMKTNILYYWRLFMCTPQCQILICI